MLAYLSGAIEYAPDLGKSWRAQITPFLQALGHEVYDPAQDEKKNLSDEEVREFRKWKGSDLGRFQGTIRKIIAWDLDWIEKKSDYVVCYWDEAAGRGAGTQGELTLAHRAGVPVYLVLGMPVENSRPCLHTRLSAQMPPTPVLFIAYGPSLQNRALAGKESRPDQLYFHLPFR